ERVDETRRSETQLAHLSVYGDVLLPAGGKARDPLCERRAQRADLRYPRDPAGCRRRRRYRADESRDRLAALHCRAYLVLEHHVRPVLAQPAVSCGRLDTPA